MLEQLRPAQQPDRPLLHPDLFRFQCVKQAPLYQRAGQHGKPERYDGNQLCKGQRKRLVHRSPCGQAVDSGFACHDGQEHRRPDRFRFRQKLKQQLFGRKHWHHEQQRLVLGFQQWYGRREGVRYGAFLGESVETYRRMDECERHAESKADERHKRRIYRQRLQYGRQRL